MTGRFGAVVARQTVTETGDGREIVSVTMKTADSGPGQTPGVAGAVTGLLGPVARIVPIEAAKDQRGVAGRHEAFQRSPHSVSAAAKTLDQLSPAEKASVTRLQQRDQQVRQEEEAHAGVAGDLAGTINYVYETGPDGRRYAVSGSVPLRSQALSGDPAQAARVGARLAAATQAATNPSAADLAAARQGYRIAGEGAANAQAQKLGRALDLSA